MAVPAWFDVNVYMANKLVQMQGADPAGNWTDAKLAEAFTAAGFLGAEGAFNHFAQFGAQEDVAPNSFFNANEYYTAKAAQFYSKSASALTALEVSTVKQLIKDAGMNAWTHYNNFGSSEKVNPSNSFDESDYLAAKLVALQAADAATWAGKTVDDVSAAFKAAGFSALTHFLLYKGTGAAEVAKDATFAVPAADQVPADTATSTGQTFTLTNSTDNIAGTTGNDTFIGDNVSTSAGDTIVGGAGEDTLKLFGVATSPNYSGIEHVYLNAPAGNFDVSGKADVKSIELDSEAGSRTLTVTTGQTVKLSNETTALQTTTIAGNTPTSLDVVVNKFGTAANQQILALTGTSVNTLNLSSATAASNLSLTNAGGKLATVNFSGDQAVTLDTLLTSITTINAANATGGLNVNSIGASDLTFTGGAGDDRINLGTTLTAADKVDGGDGTDTLAIDNSTATFTKANLVNVKGFEVLEATGAAAGAYDVDNLIANNALTGIKVSATTSATVNNINAGAVGNIVVSDSNGFGLTFTAKDFVAGGTSDTAGITLDNSVTKSGTGIDVGTGLSFANVDVLNLKTVSDGTAAKTVAS
ncbi:hypothetical protein EOL96_04700 [Candidatus Saccharibacteria bacterium]|nr:hypothetical protein [Candidatus Saccharibacteria bacterium]